MNATPKIFRNYIEKDVRMGIIFDFNANALVIADHIIIDLCSITCS